MMIFCKLYEKDWHPVQIDDIHFAVNEAIFNTFSGRIITVINVRLVQKMNIKTCSDELYVVFIWMCSTIN